MKSFLLVLAFLGVGFSGVRGQVVDTAGVVREVDSLLIEATKLFRIGKSQEALFLAQQATEMSKKTWGENNPQYASGLHRLASIYFSMSQIDTAEQLYLKAVTIRGDVLGIEHPDYSKSLNNLAVLYQNKGNYVKAEQIYLEAIKIRLKTLGWENPDYALSLVSIANLYSETGDYSKAERNFLDAKIILEKTLGKEHPDYAQTLNSLGILYMQKGDYAKAEPIYFEVKEIWAKTLGKEHPYYAFVLTNIGDLYREKGDFIKAEHANLEAIEILGKTVGKNHPNYASALYGLSVLYRSKGDFTKAEPFLLEAKEIYEENLGKDHLDYLKTLFGLALMYSDKGDYAKAEPLLLETKEIYTKTLGNAHPGFAYCLNGLASLYWNKKDYTKAESFLLESKEIRAKTLGRENPFYAYTLNDLADLYFDKRDYIKAEPYYLESNKLNIHLIEQSAAYSSENQMLSYLYTFYKSTFLFRSFSFRYTSPKLNQANFDNTLFLNGLLLENTRSINQSVAEADSLTRETFERWQGCRRRLANEYTKPITDRKYVNEVEAEAEGYEKALTRNLPAFSEARRIPHWQEVQAQLKPNEAAIEFIDFKYYTPKPTDSTLYAALILRPSPAGASANEGPKWVTLFEQRQLDALLNTNNQRTESLNQLYSPKKETVQVLDEEAPALYELVWGPLDSLLDGVKTVYFAPSGLLHRLNLGALPINDKQTLSDRYTLHQVNSTRELVIPTQVTPGASDAVVYGGIQYEMDSTAIRSGNAGKDSILIGTEEISFSSVDRSLRGDAWNYLPGTEKESTQVGKLLTKKGLKTTLRQGYAASEESFKKIGRDGQPSPKVLHIATHGFFFPDPKDTLQSKRWMSDREPVFKISDHPMIRSGLLMAGGNAAWTNQARPADLEDGILTAYEISQMNLRNTELVVLSACETGLGDIQGNEGVYGLQRAFKIAGAKYLLMSLWKVPDLQTQELMTAFYKEWSGNKTIPEAFREAQNIMRKKYPGKPFFWAGFVLIE